MTSAGYRAQSRLGLPLFARRHTRRRKPCREVKHRSIQANRYRKKFETRNLVKSKISGKAGHSAATQSAVYHFIEWFVTRAPTGAFGSRSSAIQACDAIPMEIHPTICSVYEYTDQGRGRVHANDVFKARFPGRD
jgi:hypothetical protein